MIIVQDLAMKFPKSSNLPTSFPHILLMVCAESYALFTFSVIKSIEEALVTLSVVCRISSMFMHGMKAVHLLSYLKLL